MRSTRWRSIVWVILATRWFSKTKRMNNRCKTRSCIRPSYYTQSNGYCTYCNFRNWQSPRKRWRVSILKVIAWIKFRNMKVKQPLLTRMPSAYDKTPSFSSFVKELPVMMTGRIDELHVLLLHASKCTSSKTQPELEPSQCTIDGCTKMQQLMAHVDEHPFGAVNCTRCIDLYRIMLYHAEKCPEPQCEVPRCNAVKDHLHRKTLRLTITDKMELCWINVQQKGFWPGIRIPPLQYGNVPACIPSILPAGHHLVYVLGQRCYEWFPNQVLYHWQYRHLVTLSEITAFQYFKCEHQVCIDVRQATTLESICIFYDPEFNVLP